MISFIKKLLDFFNGSASNYSLLYGIANNLCQWKQGDYGVSAAETIYGYLVPLALTLALGFVVLEIIDAVTRSGGPGNVTVEMVIMPMVKYVAAIVLILYGPQIVGYIFAGSNAFVDYLNDSVEALGLTTDVLDQAGTTYSQPKMHGLLVNTFVGLPTSLMSIIPQVIAAVILSIQVVNVKIEALLRFMFMPLAIANVPNGGVHGPGVRYIKSFFGNILMLGSILLVIKLTFLIAESITFNYMGDSTDIAGMVMNFMGGMIFKALIGPFAAIAAVQMIKSALKEAMG